MTHLHVRLNPMTRYDARTRAAEDASADRDVLAKMKLRLSLALENALSDCEKFAQSLEMIAPEKIVASLKAEFDPKKGHITDCFSEAFAEHEHELDDYMMGAR